MTKSRNSCRLKGEPWRHHTVKLAIFNGAPRAYCSRCGHWLELPPKGTMDLEGPFHTLTITTADLDLLRAIVSPLR